MSHLVISFIGYVLAPNTDFEVTMSCSIDPRTKGDPDGQLAQQPKFRVGEAKGSPMSVQYLDAVIL
jgi:hypothetical protein